MKSFSRQTAILVTALSLTLSAFGGSGSGVQTRFVSENLPLAESFTDVHLVSLYPSEAEADVVTKVGFTDASPEVPVVIERTPVAVGGAWILEVAYTPTAGGEDLTSGTVKIRIPKNAIELPAGVRKVTGESKLGKIFKLAGLVEGTPMTYVSHPYANTDEVNFASAEEGPAVSTTYHPRALTVVIRAKAATQAKR